MGSRDHPPPPPPLHTHTHTPLTQEQVVDVGDVARGVGGAILLKQAHEVAKLAVQVAKYLDGRLGGGGEEGAGVVRRGG
jgi:hypothetical protein